MADFKPVEAEKARILNVHPVKPGTPIDQANAEWVEVIVQLDSDLANWRLQRLRPLWIKDTARPVTWEWIYTWGAPAFVRAGEIYRIHSGSQVRAAMHPLIDDLAPGRVHVYAAGPIAAARFIWDPGDYVRLVDAFGTVIDEVVMWPDWAAKPPEASPAATARSS